MMIDLTEITPALIGDFLKTYEADSDCVLEPVSGLQWLDHHQSPPERAFHFFYRLEAWTLDELDSERARAGLTPMAAPGVIPDPASFLRESFSRRSSALEKWAAVYLRYFAKYTGTIKAICASAGVNVRRFYRRRDEGLAALTRLVVLAEVQARQEIQSIRLFDRLPPRDHGTLIGRDQRVLELRQMFDDPHGPRMISLEGAAGIGKTAIARQLAADLAHYNLMGGLAWVNLNPAQVSPTGKYIPCENHAHSIAGIIRAIAEQFGFEPVSEDLPPAALVSLLRDRLLMPRYLVVLDGLEALDAPGELLDLLRPLTLRVLFVFTTRRSLGDQHGVAIIPVSGLTEAQCRQMLKEECARYQVVCTLTTQQVQVLREFSMGAPGFLRLIAELLRKAPVQAVIESVEQQNLPHDMLDKLAHWFEPQLLRLSPDPRLQADSLLIIITLCCAIAHREKREWLQFVTGLPDERYYAAENVLAAHYFLVRHAASAATNEIYGLPLLRAYLHGQLLRLWKEGLWNTSAMHRSKLRWMGRTAVQLRRALRHTVQYLDRIDRATLLDGREMDRYYALLAAAHYWEALGGPAVEIILKLHPLPVLNGDWAIWQREISYAAQVLGKHGRYAEKVKLLADLQMMYFHAGRWDEVVDTFKRILKLGEAHGLPALVTRSLYILADACYYLEQHEEVQHYVELVTHVPAIQQATGDQSHQAQAWLCLTQALILRHQGQLEAAARQTVDAEAHLRACGTYDVDMLGQILQHQGLMDWATGRYAEAEEKLHRALDIFEKQDDIFSQSFVEGNLGLLYWSIGQLAEAENHSLGSAHTARMHGADWHLTAQIGNLVLIQLYRGELKAALERAGEHYELASRLNVSHEINRATVNRGVVYFHLSRIQDALESLKRGLAIRGLSPMGRACLQLYLARCYAARGQFNTAIPYLDEIQQTADETGSGPLQIILNRVRAEVTQDKAQARKYLHAALLLAEDLKRDYDRAACLLALAGLEESPSKQQLYWNSGAALLSIADAEAWLDGATFRRPPRLPALV